MSSLSDIVANRFRAGASRHTVSDADARGSVPLSGTIRQGRGEEREGVPRLVRSPMRRAVRFVETSRPMRAGLGSALALAFIASGWLYGAFSGGHGPQIIGGVAGSVGLAARDIEITGQVETSEQAVFTALGLGQGQSLVGFDANRARKRVLALPWVRDVAIRKLYPGTLKVAIAEKRAFAIWQHEDRQTVVQNTGAPIARFGIADLINNRFSHLPHLVGKGAAENAREILPIAARYPQIAGQVSSYIRVADRRWDVQLANGVRIKLPVRDLDAAFTELSELHSESRLFEREVSVVDMRVADRIVLRLLPEAAKTRADLVSARLKAMKKADRKL